MQEVNLWFDAPGLHGESRTTQQRLPICSSVATDLIYISYFLFSPKTMQFSSIILRQ
jgi:hypothetical protein